MHSLSSLASTSDLPKLFAHGHNATVMYAFSSN
jgi:hypothetical protein